MAIIQHQQETIKKEWDGVCDEAQLSTVDKNMFWGRQLFNPYIFEGLCLSELITGRMPFISISLE